MEDDKRLESLPEPLRSQMLGEFKPEVPPCPFAEMRDIHCTYPHCGCHEEED